MRPSMRRAKKKLVKTPGGRYSWHRIGKKPKAVCGVCGRPLQGASSRAHSNMCSPCSREMLKTKVSEYAKEG